MLTKREQERLDAGVEYAKSLKLDIQDALLASMHFSKGMEYGENRFMEKAIAYFKENNGLPTHYQEYYDYLMTFLSDFKHAMEE
jgi:hypothetical protein